MKICTAGLDIVILFDLYILTHILEAGQCKWVEVFIKSLSMGKFTLIFDDCALSPNSANDFYLEKNTCNYVFLDLCYHHL